MEPGKKYCPDHLLLNFPQYAKECTVCNKTLLVSGQLEVIETLAAPALKLDNPPEPEKAGPKPAKEHFAKLHETITAKIKEKIEAKKAHKGHK